MKRFTAAAAATLTLVLALVGCSFAAAAGNAPTTTTATWVVEDTTTTPTSSKPIKSANFDTSAPTAAATTTTTTPKPLIVNGTFDVKGYVLSLLPAAKATFLQDYGELKQLQIVVDLPRGETKILVLGAVSSGNQVSPSVQYRFPNEGVSYNLTPSSDTATIHGRTDRGDFFISEEVVDALVSTVPKLAAGSAVGENPFEGTGLEYEVDNTVSDYYPKVS